MIRGKDEEVDKLVLQQTQELERRHQEALNAKDRVYAGRVKELEERALKLSTQKDSLNGAMTAAQGTVVSKVGELSEANNSIRDLKLKLGDLEKMLSEAKAREGILTKELET